MYKILQCVNNENSDKIHQSILTSGIGAIG